MMDGLPDPILRFPWDDAPAHTEVIEVAEGILWVRSPLPMRLDHVNCYVLDEGDHWTLVDTGMNTDAALAAWQSLLAGPLGGKPVGRVVLTHHHPDHLGLLGWFVEQGAEVWSTKLGYAIGRMLQMDANEVQHAQSVAFRRLSGQPEADVLKYAGEKPWRFPARPIPLGFHRIAEGMTLRMGGRDWVVHFGHGHADDHATFWTDDIVLAGDQIIPGISSNIGVWAMEPEANPLAGWLESCARLRTVAKGIDPLILPGHKLPFRGVDIRLGQLIDNHTGALDRIMQAVRERPCTAADVFLPVFKREIWGSQYGLALSEAVAHMNYLHQAGRVSRELIDGAWVYAPTEGS